MCPYVNYHQTYQHLFNRHYLKAITGHMAVISHTVRVGQKDHSSHNSYRQLCKRDTKRHILLCIYVLCLTCLKNCPVFIWWYMEPNMNYFMRSTSSYSTLLPNYPSIRTIGHSTQLTQKPSSTFKPKTAHILKK
jgi:hypothetical protein